VHGNLMSGNINDPVACRQFAENTLAPWLGDQLTCARYRGIQQQHGGEHNSFDRHDNRT
jgi:hypothetical protein